MNWAKSEQAAIAAAQSVTAYAEPQHINRNCVSDGRYGRMSAASLARLG